MSLAQVYARLAEACPALGLTVGPPGPADGPGWVDGAALAGDEAALRGWLEAESARIEERHGSRARPDVAASRALHSYLWAACLLVSGPWYLERRVPLLLPGHVWLGPGAGLRVTVPDAFGCLPDDPAAGRAGTTVLDGEEALRAHLRRTVAGHAAPLLGALASRTRRGRRALWGMAGDDLVSGLWKLGAALGDEEHGAAMAALVLPGARPPFPAGADFRRLPATAAEAGRLTRTRAGCCLYYALDPRNPCATCPRLTTPGGPPPRRALTLAETSTVPSRAAAAIMSGAAAGHPGSAPPGRREDPPAAPLMIAATPATARRG